MCIITKHCHLHKLACRRKTLYAHNAYRVTCREFKLYNSRYFFKTKTKKTKKKHLFKTKNAVTTCKHNYKFKVNSNYRAIGDISQPIINLITK